ncbi:MAG: hypothetical protein FWG93_03335 [Oscillospiraceae bacterium]|nr:hypothetical protein [Oscillospiraceae bacterium]
MRYIAGYFLKRLPREGYKSLAVPALSLALVFLINLLGGLKAWMEAEHRNVLDHFEIVVELSNNSGYLTDGLFITGKDFRVFTSPDERAFPLYGYTENLRLKRTLVITEIAGRPMPGALTGITAFAALPAPEAGAAVTFFEGYDESVLETDEPVCLVGADMLAAAEDGVLRLTVQSVQTVTTTTEVRPGSYEIIDGVWVFSPSLHEATVIPPQDIGLELTVVGTVDDMEYGFLYCPFWTASGAGVLSDGQTPYTDLLSATLADNRKLSEFKQTAWRNFPRVGPVYENRPISMTVYDSGFYDAIEPLMQNMILVDAATPLVYVISVCVGFLASFLLTRRRKPEFAVMRSVGVRKRDIFFGSLLEQTALGAAGALLGCGLAALTWGYVSPARTALFLVCFMLGAAFSAIRAAGTDVLKILVDKE